MVRHDYAIAWRTTGLSVLRQQVQRVGANDQQR